MYGHLLIISFSSPLIKSLSMTLVLHIQFALKDMLVPIM